MPESLVEMPWPMFGTSIVDEFAQQPPQTTPDARNVRTCDPILLRLRGGSRSGLSRYIDAQPGDVSSVLQHLAIVSVYDPNGMGANEADLGTPAVDKVYVPTEFNRRFWKDWPKYKPKTSLADTVADPSTNGTKTRVPTGGRNVRSGGSGWMPNMLGFRVSDPPTVGSISPSTGSRAGGQPITITGENLIVPGQATTVTINGNPATLLSSSPTQLVVTSPSNGASTGAVNVAVTTPNGTVTSVGGFTYNAVPVISSLSGDTISVNGTTGFVITGLDVGSASSVTIGGNAATITGNTSTSVTVTTPSMNATSEAFVIVTTAGGASNSLSVAVGLSGEYPIPRPGPDTTAYYTGTVAGAMAGTVGEMVSILVERRFGGLAGPPYDSATIAMKHDPAEGTYTAPVGATLAGITLEDSANGTFGLPAGEFKLQS